MDSGFQRSLSAHANLFTENTQREIQRLSRNTELIYQCQLFSYASKHNFITSSLTWNIKKIRQNN